MMKINDKVEINDVRDFYSADGIIIGETPKYWKIKITNHKTMGVLWAEQKEKTMLFHKNNQLEKGFSKNINVGCFSMFSEKTDMDGGE